MNDPLIKDDINLFNNNQQYSDNADPDVDINLSENEGLNLQNPDIGYTTDSDIEDPKYMPTGNKFLSENNMNIMNNIDNIDNEDNIDNIDNMDNINNIDNINNLENLGIPSQNEMLLQTQIMNLENDTMIANKTLQQLENENDQQKEQLMKNQKN